MLPVIPGTVQIARATSDRAGNRLRSWSGHPCSRFRRAVKMLLLVNSKASSVTPRTRVVIGKALSADHDVTVAETSRRGHATRLAQGAAATGTEVVIVLGGDGTLNEAANGLAGTASALAPLPGGSTNVFARTIGLPNDPIEATGVLLDALARRSIRRVGLGSVNGRYFLFHTGVGFDAAVVEQVERRSGLKRYAGHPLFVYAGFDTWIRHYDRSRPRLRRPPRRRLGDRRRLPDDRPQHQPVHLPGQPAARPGAGGHARPGPGGGHPPHAGARADAADHRRGAGDGPGDAQQPLGRPPDRPGRAHRAGLRPGARTRSTATTWATPRCSSSGTSPTCSTSCCPSLALALAGGRRLHHDAVVVRRAVA